MTRKPAPVSRYHAFVARAAEMMVSRLEHGRRKFGGVDWNAALYADPDNEWRIRRAVDHLVAARASSPDPEEWQKRAADVANQAFMYADPERVRG